jgi:hypothetical protein
MPAFLTPTEKEKITNSEITYLNKSKDKLSNVYKTTLSTDITSPLDLRYVYQQFPGKELDFTDVDGEKLDTRKILNLKKGDIVYIKEKI